MALWLDYIQYTFFKNYYLLISHIKCLTSYSRRGEKRNKFIINIRTPEPNGLLIWMNQGPTLQGDFLAVAVIEGKIELSFNLGKQTQPIRITSDVSI